ncbi:MAG: hypothetical protein Q9170_007760 [Blastenia crenularia]
MDSQPLSSKQPRLIAKLVPNNSEAESALNRMYENPNVSDYHRQYLKVKHVQRTIEASSDSDQSEKALPTQIEFWTGHYNLAIHDDTRPTGLAPWRVGRGASKLSEKDRGVDILLIGPRDKSYQLAPVQALIRLHPESGALMLVGVMDEKPVLYESDEGQHSIIRLGNNQQHVLYRERNRFRLGNLEYTLEFEQFTPVKLSAFKAARDEVYQEGGRPSPHSSLSIVPQSSDKKWGPLITHRCMSKGTFGQVCAGVHARTGHPFAIKEQWTQTGRDSRRAEAEIIVGKRFSSHDGLLGTFHAFCEHDEEGTKVCGKVPERVFSTSTLAIGDFHYFHDKSFSPHELLDLYYGPLTGLSKLHEEGFMHRDVHLGNLLIISLEPCRAVVCDFGKAIQMGYDREGRLGPINTVAPEVDGSNFYNQKIDIWSLAFSYCQLAFPSRYRGFDPTKPVSRGWLANMTSHLQQRALVSKRNKDQTNLLLQMLAWNPRDRISAADALTHPYFTRRPPPEHPLSPTSHKIPTTVQPAPDAKMQPPHRAQPASHVTRPDPRQGPSQPIQPTSYAMRRNVQARPSPPIPSASRTNRQNTQPAPQQSIQPARHVTRHHAQPAPPRILRKHALQFFLFELECTNG